MYIYILYKASIALSLSKTLGVFNRKRRFLTVNETWLYENVQMNGVNAYKFLGLYFSASFSCSSEAKFGSEIKIILSGYGFGL